MTSFFDIFQQQKEYNVKIRLASDQSVEAWTETYLLGLISEVDDILDGISWKRHRRKDNKLPDPVNLGYDLADLTKYILSMWELWGYQADDVIYFVDKKNRLLDELYRQEFEPIPENRLIVITDLDGTLGDWRRSFIDWVSKTHGLVPTVDGSRRLQLDSDLAMRYDEYYALKEEFESSGQYANIEVYPDALALLHWLKGEFNAYIIAHTARPWKRYHRIWADTWEWLYKNEFPIDQLRMGSDSRVLLASSLGGANVLMLEDDPGLMLRAAHSGIKVVARKHPYNDGVNHEHITMVGDFTQATERIEHDFKTYRK